MVKKPWEQYNGEETQRKQTGDAQEVSGPPTGSSSADSSPASETTGVMAPAPRPDINAESSLGERNQESFTEYNNKASAHSTEASSKNEDFTIPEEDLDKWRYGEPDDKPFPTYPKEKDRKSKKNADDDKVTKLPEVTISAKRPEKKEEVTKTYQPVTSEHRTAPNSSPAPNFWQQANGTYNNVREMANAIKEEQERERMQEQQKSDRQRHDSYVKETNKALDEARKSGSLGVKPLNVGTITPAISGDPNETEEQKQARIEKRKLENYAQEHPWVLEKDYSTMRNKYKDKKWSEIVNEVAAYREKTGNPMSYEEKMYMLSQYNPDTSKKEEVREKRLAYWADALNQLGNVLAHFYNYGRAKGGSPAAQIPDNKSSYSERLRAADMAMRQRGYNDYVNALANAQKRKQTREDMEYRLRMQEAQEQRMLANQIALKEHEWLSPKYKLELERLGKDLSNKDTQLELNKAKLAYQMMVNEGKSAEQALEISYKRLRNALENKKLNDGDGKPYKVGGQSYSDAYAAYKRGVILYNKTHPNNQKKVVNSTKFNSKPNDYLKEVGVETN